jgi:virginiamycin B lyase
MGSGVIRRQTLTRRWAALLVAVPVLVIGMTAGTAAAAGSGKVKDFTGTGINFPNGITAGPNGALWFTNDGNGTIGCITIKGIVTNYTSGSANAITTGPDGALWFANGLGNSIGRITTTGVVAN